MVRDHQHHGRPAYSGGATRVRNSDERHWGISMSAVRTRPTTSGQVRLASPAHRDLQRLPTRSCTPSSTSSPDRSRTTPTGSASRCATTSPASHSARRGDYRILLSPKADTDGRQNSSSRLSAILNTAGCQADSRCDRAAVLAANTFGDTPGRPSGTGSELAPGSRGGVC